MACPLKLHIAQPHPIGKEAVSDWGLDNLMPDVHHVDMRLFCVIDVLFEIGSTNEVRASFVEA